MTSDPAVSFQNPITETIARFLRDIGLQIEAAELDDSAFLPGLVLDGGRILVDETQLKYPGDILHEAGHLAVTPASERGLCGGNLAVGGAAEMAAISWSYAAALHIGLDPAVVFHSDGYRNGSNSLLENFSNGLYLAVPYLQWIGMTFEKKQAEERGVDPYPKMIRWLRE